MVNFKPDKQDMEKQIKRNLYYFKNQQKIIDAQKTKAEMVALRIGYNSKILIIINQSMTVYDKV